MTASLTSAVPGKEQGEHFALPAGKHLYFGFAFECESLALLKQQAQAGQQHLYHAVLRLEDQAPGKGRASLLYTYLQLYAPEEASENFSAAVIRQKREVNGLAYDLAEVFNSEESDSEQNLCLICMSEPPDCILLPCRHMVINIDCAKLIDEKSTHKFECPLCRATVEELIYVNYDRKRDSLLHSQLTPQPSPVQPPQQPALEDLPAIVDRNQPLQTN